MCLGVCMHECMGIIVCFHSQGIFVEIKQQKVRKLEHERDKCPKKDKSD